MKGGESSILRVSSTCYRCRKPGHEPKSCRFKAAKCHKCRKVGHILPACRSKGRKIPAGQGQQQQRKARSKQNQSEIMKWVEVVDSSAPPMDKPGIDMDTNGLSLFAIGEATRDSSIKVVVTIEWSTFIDGGGLCCSGFFDF